MKVDKLNQLLEDNYERVEGNYIVRGVSGFGYFDSKYIQSEKEIKNPHSTKDLYVVHWDLLKNKNKKNNDKKFKIDLGEFGNLKVGQKVRAIVNKNLDVPQNSVVEELWLIDKPKTTLFSKPKIELD